MSVARFQSIFLVILVREPFSCIVLRYSGGTKDDRMLRLSNKRGLQSIRCSLYTGRLMEATRQRENGGHNRTNAMRGKHGELVHRVRVEEFMSFTLKMTTVKWKSRLKGGHPFCVLVLLLLLVRFSTDRLHRTPDPWYLDEC